VHSFAVPFLTSIMQAASFVGSTLFLILLGIILVALLYVKKHRHGAILFAITTVGAGVLNFLLKLAFHRARPEPFFNTILPSSYSFPSGHSLGSFCFYLALAAILTNRVEKFWLKITIWTLAVSLVLLIGMSRIYLGVHYPSDVLAGFVVGFIWVMTVAVGDKLIHAKDYVFEKR
ncbi:MAG: phosphatase PAP2 family protein, partial [Acidobacteriota bacterium]